MSNEENRISARAARYIRVGGNVGAVAARVAGQRLFGFEPDNERDARDLAKALGGLKGPIMKVAQLLSTIPEALPAEYARELAQLGHLRVDEIRSDFRFLVVRAKPDHPDAWLTNRLISDFVPSDFLSRYVFNKQGFYADYTQFDAVWQRYVVDTLKSTYLSDKDGFRARLYGLED